MLEFCFDWANIPGADDQVILGFLKHIRQIDPDIMTSYYPFIRLALARYQPNSISNAHLSRVVLTDFVQVANDRTLNIEHKGGQKNLYVSVVGRATGDKSVNRVEVSVESLASGANPEFGWIPVNSVRGQPNPYTLKPSLVDAATYLWKWEANLKVSSRRSAKNYRLVIREYEKFEADADLDKFILLGAVLDPHSLVRNVERMVYADIVVL